MHKRHWRENTARRKSLGGLTLATYSHGKAHKRQDNDGQTQTSVSWAGRPPPSPFLSLLSPSPSPPSPHRVKMPTVGGAAAPFACRSAALQISTSCHIHMNASAPSSTRWKHLPAFCAAFATLRTSCQIPSCLPPGAPSNPFLVPLSSPYPNQLPKVSSSVADAPPPYMPQDLFNRTLAASQPPGSARKPRCRMDPGTQE